MVSWLHYFGPPERQSIMVGECAVEQGCSPQGSWEGGVRGRGQGQDRVPKDTLLSTKSYLLSLHCLPSVH
jgi:hypothetical protein